MGVGFRCVGFRVWSCQCRFGVAGFGSTVCMQMKPKACAELGFWMPRSSPSHRPS